VLGEMALLAPGGVRSASAVALEPTETLTIDAGTFTDLRREQPVLTEVLVALLAARVRQLDDRLLEALYVPVDTRLLRRMLELGDMYGAEIPLTQEDLAGLGRHPGDRQPRAAPGGEGRRGGAGPGPGHDRRPTGAGPAGALMRTSP